MTDEQKIEIPLKRRTQREKLAYFQGYHAAIDKNIPMNFTRVKADDSIVIAWRPLHFTRELVNDGIVAIYRDGDRLVIKVRDKIHLILDAQVVELIKPMLQSTLNTMTRLSGKQE